MHFLDNRPNVYLLGKQCRDFGQSPAARLGVRNPILAYDFDNAVSLVLNWIEAKAQETNKSGKPRYSMEYLLTGKVTQKPVNAKAFVMLAGHTAVEWKPKENGA